MENKDCLSKVYYVESSGAVSGLVKSLELSPVVKNWPALPGSEGEAIEFALCLLFLNCVFSSK